jgi:methionyl-tRNA formyltransferase
VRAYDPKPGAWSTLRGAEVKLFGARLAPRGLAQEPGAVIAIDASGMLVACGSGAVRITAVQPSGKRRLAPLEWANGRGVAVGDLFDTSAPAAP